jgi:serine/threonine-protein kinase RsbW
MGSSTGPGHPDRPDHETGQRPQAPAAGRADAPRWRQAFEGEERQLGVMRRWLASVLPACPARDDVISVATELASNALRHTESGNGGLFAVEITWQEPAVRIGVADGGGPAEPHVIEDPDGEHGRGLLLVRGLSLRTGVTGDRHGRLVWADVAWDGPLLPSSPAPAGLDEAAIRDGEASLARRFAGVPAWFGPFHPGVVGAGQPDRAGHRPDGAGTGRPAGPVTERSARSQARLGGWRPPGRGHPAIRVARSSGPPSGRPSWSRCWCPPARRAP